MGTDEGLDTYSLKNNQFLSFNEGMMVKHYISKINTETIFWGISLVFLFFIVPLLLYFFYEAYLNKTQYHVCGEVAPIRSKIQQGENNNIFTCDVLIQKDADYSISLRYSYGSSAQRDMIREMLGGTIQFKEVNGVLQEIPNSKSSLISFSIFTNGESVAEKTNASPRITAHVYGDQGGLDTQLTMIRMYKDKKYTIKVSGIPQRHWDYGEIYLVVGRRFH